MQPFFIAATGTDIGKTLVTTALCWQLRQAGKTVTALKPVISGFDANDPSSDTALILKSCGMAMTPSIMDVVSPWRYSLPLAPNMAAAKEKKQAPSVETLVEYCQDHMRGTADYMLVESAGGVMAPVSDDATVIDWIMALNWRVILVAGTYLGSISHTLTALEALRVRGVTPHALVISESKGGVAMADTVATLEKFMPRDFPIVKIPRVAQEDELWKYVPSISWICSHD
jgi:dethiobiotin synthetase